MLSGGMMSRRELLQASAALPAAGAARASPDGAGLDDLARERGLRFGSAFAWSRPNADAASFANPAYAALLKKDCGLLVPENEMKWQAIRPAPGKFDFQRMDAMVDYAMANGFAMRGHTLLWHYHRWFPRWLNEMDFGLAPAVAAANLLADHIRTVATRYGKRIYSYDVVNEAVDPDDGSLRQTSLSRAMGSAEAVLDHAFHVAHEAAPHAELVYNDYMSWEDGNEAHRDGVLKLLEGFRKRGTPVHTLGVQSHIGVFKPVASIDALVDRLAPAWRSFLDKVTEMGFRLVITEFDVRDRGLPADPNQRDAGVARFAGAYLDLMLSYPQLHDILVWGMSDRYSWLRGFEPREDGQMTRGSPYDTDLKPKPLYRAIEQSLRSASPRSA